MIHIMFTDNTRKESDKTTIVFETETIEIGQNAILSLINGNLVPIAFTTGALCRVGNGNDFFRTVKITEVTTKTKATRKKAA